MLSYYEILELVKHRDGDGCKLCGKIPTDSDRYFLHHVISVREGGSDNPSNRILVCPQCHGYIHSDNNSGNVIRRPDSTAEIIACRVGCNLLVFENDGMVVRCKGDHLADCPKSRSRCMITSACWRVHNK